MQIEIPFLKEKKGSCTGREKNEVSQVGDKEGTKK